MKQIKTMMSLATALALAVSAVEAAAQDRTVQISTNHTTHLVFTTDLTYVDISNRVIVAKIVDSSKNILALKAREPFDFTTTVSILESNGQLHTYYVTYDQDPDDLVRDMRSGGEQSAPQPSVSSTRRSDAPELSEIAQMKQGIHHVADRRYGLTAMVDNILVYSDMTYVSISLRNDTGISYESSDARFVIETARRSRRGLDVDRTLASRSRWGTLTVPAGETVRVVYSFPKVTLTRDQMLRIYLYEQSGSRNLSMTLGHRDVNNAGQAQK